MQIHELTRPQQTNEAISLSNIKSAAGKIGNQVKSAAGKIGDRIAQNPVASALAQSMNQSLGTNIGGAAAGARVAPGFAGQAATQVNQGMVKQLAQEQAGLWAQSLQAALKQTGTPYMSQLNQAELEKIARDMVNRTLERTTINSYQQLANTVDTAKKPEAQAVQKSIDTLIQQLAKTAVSPSIRSSELERENAKIWNLLATEIAKTQNLATFNRKQTLTPATNTAANPQLQAAMKATGMNAATLAKLNGVVKQSGERLNITTTGSATVDALLKAAKLI